jgi:aminopeptidase N
MRTGLAGIWMLFAFFGFADTYVRQPSVDVIRYDISLELVDPVRSIAGTTKAQVRIRGKSVSGMWLDFEDMSIDRFLVAGVDAPYTFRNGRLTCQFDRTYSRNELVLIEVHYHGKPQQGILAEENRYGSRVVFANNWPNNAHHWFPSIDHPSDKAAVSFSVTAPAKYSIVANGRQTETALLPDGRKTTKWSEDKAIPTYCMVFGMAEFTVTPSITAAGLPLAWYAFPQDAGAAAAKFSRTALILDYFQNTIGPYPYEKLAQIESIIPMGGMENSSAIFYSESSFAGDPVSEEPVAHEIAHQWFGNSVTEADWDDLWLSEGFATYFEALFYEHLAGPETMRRFMARHADTIMEYEAARSAPIVNVLQTDPMKKLNPLSYEKGAWVLHMLRGMLGDKAFFEGIRSFYKQYEGGNASSRDFQKVMESSSGIKLSRFFRQWLGQPGWPEYRISWRWNQRNGFLEILIRQMQRTGLFEMPLEIAVTLGNLKTLHKFRVRNSAQTLGIRLGTRPTSVEIDPDNRVLKSVIVD